MVSESEYYSNLISHYHTHDLEVILFSPTVANKHPVPDDFIEEILKYTFRNNFQRHNVSYITYNTTVIDNYDYYLRMLYNYWIFDPPSVGTSKYNVLTKAIHTKITSDSHALHGLRKQFVFNAAEVEDLGDINENYLTRQLQCWIASHNITKQIVYTRDLILDEEEYYYYKLIGKSRLKLSDLILGATVAPYWRVPDDFLYECASSEYEQMPNKDYYFRMIYSYWIFDPPEAETYKYKVLTRAINERCRDYKGTLYERLIRLVYGDLGDSRYDECGHLIKKYVNNNNLTKELKHWLKSKNMWMD